MGATVYVWGDHDLTGHVSVEIEGDYLSFHPKNRNYIRDVLGTPGFLGNDYYEDREHHGSEIESIHVNWLDDDAMRNKMQHFRNLEYNDSLTYNLFLNNCSTLAMELLCSGANEDFHHGKTLGHLFNVYRNRITNRDHHHRLLEDARDTLEDYAVVCSRGNHKGTMSRFLLPLLTADFISREFIYSPGDIRIFASELADANH